MPTDIQTADLPALIAEATSLGAEFARRFAGLSAAQLNWRPSEQEWSIAYCVEHVIVANSGYFAPIDQILAGTKASSFWERLPLLPGLFGGFLIRTLEPGGKGFVPAPKVFLPSSTDIPADILARFAAQHAELLALMERCRALDTAAIIVTSPAADFVTYSLLDAFRIIVVHMQHHLHQTSKLLAMAEFPGS
ncbi:DinB family protein [Oscillochloris sp. ZM17-4]|uniref:DinB family protein n=1 Tax=Oscillochloris sp. ZM17-4 TaxID=2866714 RepID=UPI001C73DC66|nr:DinB family protein [Oscillochloris sp. ZM17-4]MBX0329344.1 DinB family protein [Oscillochloris sp. ZM17-4]